MIHNPLIAGSLVLLVVIAMAAGGALLAQDLLNERRDLLIQKLESDMGTSVASVAGLVSERARDIRSDLLTAAEVATQGRVSLQASLELVRAHLIALDRSTKHYRKLWHVRAGEAVTEVSGFRQSELPVPEVIPDSVTNIAVTAREQAGKIATLVPKTTEPTKYEHLQLFALANRNRSGEVIVVLVSMDTLFDSLQRRARLPGADLWVVDAHGNTLVDPGDVPPGHQARIMAVLTSRDDAGSHSIGPVPSPWPFSSRGSDSELVVWRSAQGPTIRWTTGMVTSLSRVGAELKGTAARLIVVGAIVFVAIAMAILVSLWFYSRQRRLKERVAYRDQLVHAERLSTLGQIAASVAHEIGTPLGVISIRLDQLLDKKELGGEHDKINVMKEQIERITRIMRRMLDYARPRSGSPQKVALKTVVGRVHDLVEHRLRKQGISFKSSLPDDVFVVADFDELHQVFLNLLVNASDACQSGDRISIAIADASAKGRIRVEVLDSGPGVDEQALESVFEPFFSTKAAGEGTGLGLTIVKDIMERHGGGIEISRSANGAKFVLEWPAPKPVPNAEVSERGAT